jgi:hypothetical protein
MSDDLFEQTGPDRHMCIAELQRELKVRERLYPHWAEAGKIDPKTAAHRILCLRVAIAMLEEGL